MTFEEPRFKEGEFVTVSREALRSRPDLEPVMDKVGAICELDEDNGLAEVVFPVAPVGCHSPGVMPLPSRRLT
jgi:hypothetical protein